MGFALDKRRFFVEVLGEERVRQMEKHLPALAKELEVLGVAFKDLIYDVVSFGDEEAVRLFEVFLGIAGNIVHHTPENTTPEKLALLKQAVGDLASRIGGAGGKTTDPAQKYITDLAANRPAESQASKALRETGRPGADYAADLLDGKVITS